ncbi:exodeoxyribonuclease VII small subunit [Knoellia sinensis KCTC 19936]|uniref:Exodeoxyribonuclease VII small subunit n=1 Tax=Knoellia sinensis KCTC 19936 TaxID=1385520 RepID=A0A0A0J8F6_9MICO|nr:exodeoxyribonuclease VII small subunit [Knoellia sinensis]KGN33700.1 exodeoxyribonuclease VII small subunit [Knoellia sinensis KCTC 19936]
MAKDIPQPETADADGAAVDAPATDANADVAEMSYEAARDELVDIVARLEGGQVGLEDSMGLWQRGEALAAHCAQWLDEAEAKLKD